MERVGLRVAPAYRMTESSTSALGCRGRRSGRSPYPKRGVRTDHASLPGRRAGDHRSGLDLSRLVDPTPKAVLNVQIDDYTVEEHPCGSPSSYSASPPTSTGSELQQAGRQHITLIATTSGTSSSTPWQRAMEAVPWTAIARRGGRADRARLLLIHPRIKITDESAVMTAVLEGLRRRRRWGCGSHGLAGSAHPPLSSRRADLDGGWQADAASLRRPDSSVSFYAAPASDESRACTATRSARASSISPRWSSSARARGCGAARRRGRTSVAPVGTPRPARG